MKKFTFLMIALFIAAMGFAQGQAFYKSASPSAKPYLKNFASSTKVETKAPATSVRATRDNTVVFSEGFEFSGTALENGWTSSDEDGDGNNWALMQFSHSGSYSITSASYDNNSGPLTPNNWLISPAIDLTAQSGTIKLGYYIAGTDDAWFREHYKVCISTTNASVSSFTNTVFEETIPQSGWNERAVDISSYAGQTIYVAFVHYNITDMYMIALDDVSVFVDQSTDAAVAGITAPTHGDFSTCALSNEEDVTISVINNGGAPISNFEVSYTINGGAAVTETVTASVAPAETYEYTFTQKANLSAVGTYTIVASVNLTGDETAANNNASMTITNGDAKITFHAQTDAYGGSEENRGTYTITNTLTDQIVAERTSPWQWYIEVYEYVCVDASACYTIEYLDADGMQLSASDTEHAQPFLEILYNGTQVAGSTTELFLGPSLIAERLGNGCSTDPEIATDDTEFEFAAIIGEPSNAQTATIRAFNLTEGITATTAAPFEVSADNTTFAATATLPVDGGTLYIRYNPTEAGEQTGSVVLSSTGAENVTITLSGTAIDCSVAHTAPFSETFAVNSETIACWTIIDANNDGRTFGFGYTDQEQTDLAAAYQYSADNAANDWLISPKLSIGENQRVRFDVSQRSTTYPEKYKVYVITESPNNYANGTLVRDESTPAAVWSEMETITVDLSSYNGQEIYIGIQCVSPANMYIFFVDNFELSFNPTNAEIALTSVTPATGTTVQTGQNINISGVVANNGIALTSYKVSYTVDGGAAVDYTVNENVAVGASHNFTHATPVVLETAGEHTIVVTVSEPNGVADGDASDNSMTITLNAVSCDPITEFPYEEGFENGIPQCWTIIDADEDGHNWMALTDLFSSDVSEYVHGGADAAISQSYENYVGAYNANNWLITSAITIPENGEYTASWYAASMDDEYPDSYSVYIGTEPTVAGMTANAAVLSHTPSEWEMKSVSLAAYAGQTIYIGFNHVDSDKYVLMIDDFSVVLGTAVEENIADAIAVYPNPTSSMVTIANAEGKDIIVVNSLGQVVASIENAAANQTIDVANFANGTYFVKVDGEVVKLNVVK